MINAATPAAPTAIGERRKLQKRSLSPMRRRRPGVGGAVSSTAMGTGYPALEPQSRIDDVIEKIDEHIDDDEKESDQHEISGHHRDIGESDRLDHEESHTWPLKDGL